MSNLITGCIALAAAIIVFIIEVKYARANPKQLPARVKKAQALGHVVTAHKTEQWRDGRLHEDTKYYEAYYSYEVNGRKYRYSFMEPAFPPETITLYYLSDPRRAFWGLSKTAGQKSLKLINWLLPLITFIAVVLLLKSSWISGLFGN